MNKTKNKLSFIIEMRKSNKRKKQERKDTYNKITYKPFVNKVNAVIGSLCVVYGIGTILLPTGSIFAIMLGLFLISCPISILSLLKGLCKDIWAYVGCLW